MKSVLCTLLTRSECGCGLFAGVYKECPLMKVIITITVF